jgi:hypothetical protein
VHGGIQQLAFLAPPVSFEVTLENHPQTSEDKVAQRSSQAKVTEVQRLLYGLGQPP